MTLEPSATAAARRAAPGHRHAAGAAPFRLRLPSPVGTLLLAGDDTALTHLLLPGGHDVRSTRQVTGPVRAAADQLEEYFGGRRRQFDLPLAPRGTAFQLSVWRKLSEIPYGETISYAELAAWVGRPGAFRAVGQANGANPIAIIVPCHRVVAAGGGLGGYGGGLDLKRRLLDLERYAAAAAADMAGNGPASAARPASPSAAKAGSKSRSVSSAAAS